MLILIMKPQTYLFTQKGVLFMNLCSCGSKVPAAECGCGQKLPAPGPGVQLAIATVPMQPWETPYEPAKALKQGTIFPCLDLPFFIVGGGTNA